MGGFVESAMQKVADFGNIIRELIPGMEAVGDEAYGHSLFPKIVEWAEKAGQSVMDMGKQILSSAQAAAQASTQMAQAQTALAAQQAYVQAQGSNVSQGALDVLAARERIAGISPSMAPTTTAPTTPAKTYGSGIKQLAPGVYSNIARETGGKSDIVINYNGMNMVDESSQRRMVSQISNVQKSASMRTVTTR
jgi:type II secretory pathway pseudopilin PulG